MQNNLIKFKIFLFASLLLLLSSCSGLGVAKAAFGAVDIIPDVASVQLGRTNSQTIGKTDNTDISIEGNTNSVIRPVIRPTGITTTEKVDTIVQNNSTLPLSWVLYVILWSIFLWELPRFSTIVSNIKNFKQKQ